MKIVSIKLSTGEELIGALDTDSGDFLSIHEPYIVNYIMTAEYGQGMRLSPFMPCVKDRLFTLNTKYVIVKADVDNDSEEYYLKCLEQSTAAKNEFDDDETIVVDLSKSKSPSTLH